MNKDLRALKKALTDAEREFTPLGETSALWISAGIIDVNELVQSMELDLDDGDAALDELGAAVLLSNEWSSGHPGGGSASSFYVLALARSVRLYIEVSEEYAPVRASVRGMRAAEADVRFLQELFRSGGTSFEPVFASSPPNRVEARPDLPFEFLVDLYVTAFDVLDAWEGLWELYSSDRFWNAEYENPLAALEENQGVKIVSDPGISLLHEIDLRPRSWEQEKPRIVARYLAESLEWL